MAQFSLKKPTNQELEIDLAEKMLQKLTKLNLSEERCINALASTGYIDCVSASKWLIDHVDDPDADKPMKRECSLFLCPEGNFVTSLLEFWQESQKVIGWNAALEYPPHITLLPPFEISNSKLPLVHQVLNDLIQNFINRLLIDKLPLNWHRNNEPTFLGFVVPTYTPATNMLEEFTLQAIDALQKLGVNFTNDTLSKRKGIYHLSMAYGHRKEHVEELEKIVTNIFSPTVLKEPCDWDIRLYSRDGRLAPNKDVETYRMRTNYQSDAIEELNFSCDDYVGLIGGGNADGSLSHGWINVLNLNSGVRGGILAVMGERVPQYHSWVLHRVWKKSHSSPLSQTTPGDHHNHESTTMFPFQIHETNSSSSSAKDSRAVNRSSSLKCENKPRRLLIMRHGERVDLCFGRGWIQKCVDEKGIYKRSNLNMPLSLPYRPLNEFALDSPLTQLGCLVSQEVGRTLAITGTKLHYCYVSPALRCIQTATELLKGCGQNDISLRIEPHLFEWLGWYSCQMPKFLTPIELRKAGYNVDAQYKSLTAEKDFDHRESIEKYYERTAKVIKKLVEIHKIKGTTVLVVAHAGSLDTCSRALIGKTFSLSISRSLPSSSHHSVKNGKSTDGGGSGGGGSLNHFLGQDFQKRCAHVPFCGMAMVEEIRPNKWQLTQPPVPAFTHGQNVEFDWRTLL